MFNYSFDPRTFEQQRALFEMERQQAEERAKQRRKAALQQQAAVVEPYDEISRQLILASEDFKKFNRQWDTEGSAQCVTYRAILEHLTQAQQILSTLRAAAISQAQHERGIF